jgi:hypothetical protein
VAYRPRVISLTGMPTGWRGRILAAALVLLVAAVLYLALVAPLWNLYGEQASAIDRRQMLLPRLNALAAGAPQLRARLAALRAAAHANTVTLNGTSDAIASAGLENRIDQLASSLGVSIGSTETLPPQEQGAYRRIGLRLTLSGPYEALIKLIAALETAVPPLVIENVQLRSTLITNPFGGIKAVHGPTTSTLSAELDIYGFREKTPPAAKS